jgi:hypothetical protein
VTNSPRNSKASFFSEKYRISNPKVSKIPEDLFPKLAATGAIVEELDGGSLYSVHNIDYGDEAWSIYKDWAMTVEDDPRIGAGFFPSAAILNSTICPSLTLVHPIQVEANSLIRQYSTLRMQDFANGNVPVIAGPVAAFPMLTNVQHATIAVSKMMEAIQAPPANYPIISGLKSGSYICTVINNGQMQVC